MPKKRRKPSHRMICARTQANATSSLQADVACNRSNCTTDARTRTTPHYHTHVRATAGHAKILRTLLQGNGKAEVLSTAEPNNSTHMQQVFQARQKCPDRARCSLCQAFSRTRGTSLSNVASMSIATRVLPSAASCLTSPCRRLDALKRASCNASVRPQGPCADASNECDAASKMTADFTARSPRCVT